MALDTFGASTAGYTIDITKDSCADIQGTLDTWWHDVGHWQYATGTVRGLLAALIISEIALIWAENYAKQHSDTIVVAKKETVLQPQADGEVIAKEIETPKTERNWLYIASVKWSAIAPWFRIIMIVAIWWAIKTMPIA